MPDLIEDLIDVLERHGLINENGIRNFRIRKEFYEMRDNGFSSKEAREQLAEKYFMSLKNIDRIIYGKRKIRS